MPEQEERAYRLFTLDETLDLADSNPDVEISPANVGQRITVPISRKQQLPNHHWRKDKERHDATCALYQGRLGSVMVSVPNLPLKQVRPDLSWTQDERMLFYQNPYYVDETLDSAADATIQDGRLERVEEVALQDQAILDTRSAIMDAIEKGDKSAHFLIDHPYRRYHTTGGSLIAFRDKVEVERMIAVVINDVRLHNTIGEVLACRGHNELGSATEEAIRQEWRERMRTESQAFEFHGLKSFKFRKFPTGIPVRACKKK